MSGRILALVVSLSLLCGIGAVAAPPRLAVGDFTVTSDNPKLKYVGKGIAEMVAADLAQSKGVVLIDRARRDAALSELEFSLSEAADSSAQTAAGRLLSADYLLFGEIVDMSTAVLVSCKMISVETGEVVWTDKNLGPLSDYDSIARRLSASALAGLGVTGTKVAALPSRPAASAEKRLEAVIAFSKAVDSLDKKDNEEARKQIEVAKAIDPGNVAVAIYAAKLAGGSPRFLVELDSYAPTYNPALLGFVDKLTIYAWYSGAKPVGSDVQAYDVLNFQATSDPLDTIEYKETNTSNRVGVMVPIAGNIGLLAEYSSTFHIGNVGSYTPASWTFTNPGFTSTRQVNLDQNFNGANIGVGIRLLPTLGLGVSGSVVYLPATIPMSGFVFSDVFPLAPGIYYGATVGLSYRSPGGVLSGDAEVVWTNEPVFYLLSPPGGHLGASNGTLVQSSQPLVVSAGLAGGFFDQRLFANLRGIGEVGLDDRGFFALRAIPGLEWWPFPWIAVRAGYEFSFVFVQKGGFTGGSASGYGSGFMAGATGSLWGFELSLNYINRYRPFRQLPGAGHQDQALLIGLSYAGLLERK